MQSGIGLHRREIILLAWPPIRTFRMAIKIEWIFWTLLGIFLHCLEVSHQLKPALVLSTPISCDVAIVSLQCPAAQLCDTHFASHRAIIVRCPTKTSAKEFWDNIATSTARYEKYHCWASKHVCETSAYVLLHSLESSAYGSFHFFTRFILHSVSIP